MSKISRYEFLEYSAGLIGLTATDWFPFLFGHNQVVTATNLVPETKPKLKVDEIEQPQPLADPEQEAAPEVTVALIQGEALIASSNSHFRLILMKDGQQTELYLRLSVRTPQDQQQPYLLYPYLLGTVDVSTLLTLEEVGLQLHTVTSANNSPIDKVAIAYVPDNEVPRRLLYDGKGIVAIPPNAGYIPMTRDQLFTVIDENQVFQTAKLYFVVTGGFDVYSINGVNNLGYAISQIPTVTHSSPPVYEYPEFDVAWDFNDLHLFLVKINNSEMMTNGFHHQDELPVYHPREWSFASDLVLMPGDWITYNHPTGRGRFALKYEGEAENGDPLISLYQILDSGEMTRVQGVGLFFNLRTGYIDPQQGLPFSWEQPQGKEFLGNELKLSPL